MDTLGIYVHIPFCIKKCRYCDFCSAGGASDETKRQYIDALIAEILQSSEKYGGYEVDSIFFGGGTPTCLEADDICKVLDTINKTYNVSDDTEITSECNPATASYDYFRMMRNAGFNRLSIGLQSADDSELRELGRIHSLSDFENTYEDAQKAGFSNINIDLMYGIPLQSEKSFEKTLEKVIAYSPSHISAYSLKIEPGTVFYKNRDKLILPDEDAEYNMYKAAVTMLGGAGYSHYEISNYAKPGKESRHNLKYWNLDEYLGFGAAAHSLIKDIRYENTSKIGDYIGHFLSDESVKYQSIEEVLSAKEKEEEEYVMMRMRLRGGYSPEEFTKKTGLTSAGQYAERLERFVKSGHVLKRDGGYSFSDEGMYVSNYILTEILDLDE